METIEKEATPSGPPESRPWAEPPLQVSAAGPRGIKLACLRRIAEADLEGDRRLLLVDCVEAYLELNSEEAAEYARLAKVRENRELRTMATTWSQRIAAQAREEGLQAGRQAGLKEGLKMGRVFRSKPATHSDVKAATHSGVKAATRSESKAATCSDVKAATFRPRSEWVAGLPPE